MFRSVKFGLLSVYAAVSFAMAFGQSNIQGKMYGGQQPIAGARVYLLSPAQSTTFGSPSVSLITPGPNTGTDAIGVYVLTDQNGEVQINGQYTCTPNIPIYFYYAMGNAGYGANAAIANMAYIGSCGNVNQGFIITNEATTVALAYAVAGYATDPLHITYSGTSASIKGIQNAFANAANLANVAYGTANSTIPSGYATAPQATVNTIADALASCINETTQGSTTSNCVTLFQSTSFNQVAPTNTAASAMNIAHSPASSMAPGIQNGTDIAFIMSLAQAYEQFTPILTSAPKDLTLGLTFSGGGIGSPNAIAIDGTGNAWIASMPSTNANVGASVIEISNPTEMQISNISFPVSYTPLFEAESIAVDAASNNIWIGTDNAVEEFSNMGVPASGSPFLDNFGVGYALNLDSAGNVWIAGGNTIYELSASGMVLSPPGGYTLPPYDGSAEPSAIALDPSSHVWITDYSNNLLDELDQQGNMVPVSSTTLIDAPSGLAIDANHNKWIANEGSANNTNGVVEYFDQTSQYAFYQIDTPPLSPQSSPILTSVAMDGGGNPWASLETAACFGDICIGVAALSGTTKNELTGSGYTVDGHQNSAAELANETAIDSSGNVWVLNTDAESVTELIGAAVPVVTPLALAVSTNMLGTRP